MIQRRSLQVTPENTRSLANGDTDRTQ